MTDADKRRKPKWLILIAAFATIALFVIVIAISNSPSRRVARLLDFGQKYLEDGEYEQAIATFEEVLTIDPKNVDTYIGEADAYVAIADYESAIAVLEKGYELTGDATLKRQLNEMKIMDNSNEGSSGGGDSAENAEIPKSDTAEDIYGRLFDGIQQTGDFMLYGRPFSEWTYEKLENFILSTGKHAEDAGTGWVYDFEGGRAARGLDADLNEMEYIHVENRDYDLSADGVNRLISLTAMEEKNNKCPLTPALGMPITEFLSQNEAEEILDDILSLPNGERIENQNEDQRVFIDRTPAGDWITFGALGKGNMIVIGAKKFGEEWVIIDVDRYW